MEYTGPTPYINIQRFGIKEEFFNLTIGDPERHKNKSDF